MGSIRVLYDYRVTTDFYTDSNTNCNPHNNTNTE